MTLYRLEELFPAQIEERLRYCPMLILPFGTIEWHSYHLPLGLDGLVAQAMAQAIAQRTDAILAPVSYYAVGGVPFPYTLNVSLAVIEPLLVAVYEQFAAMGFRTLVAFTGHFGLEQTLAIKRAAVAVMQRSAVTILPVTPYDMTTDAGYTGDHAGIGETSLLWSVRPDLVRLDTLPRDQLLDGVLGADPRDAASPATGLALAEVIVARTAEVAQRLLQTTAPIQRAAYLEALGAGVRVLEHTAQQRQVQPKQAVPTVTTTAYLGYCQAMYVGDYKTARHLAEQKWADLAA